MCLKIPDQFRIAMDSARKSGDCYYKAEAKYFGFDHGGVGGALLRSWNLPERLQESVAHHHNPSAAKNYGHEAAVIFLPIISATKSLMIRMMNILDVKLVLLHRKGVFPSRRGNTCFSANHLINPLF